MRLKDKIALITGGASGIGAAAAQLFIEQGAYVLIVERCEKTLKETADSINSPRLSYFAADVADPLSVEAYTREAVDRFGGLDIAILNAGITGPIVPLDDYPLEEFDRVMSINLRGVWVGVKSAAREMKKRGGGSIVITSSIQGLSSFENTSAYTCSKHAVIGLMRGAAVEYAMKNIRVNTVNPGYTDTPMIRSIDLAEETITDTLPMRRCAQPREIANMMLFLASDEASYCTGSTYVVDGALLSSYATTADQA